MTSSPVLNEKSYRESKQKNLENLLGEYCENIEWIWIGGNSRRKVAFQIDGKNRLGFFAEKSHDLIEINDGDLVEKEIAELIPLLKNFLKTQEQNFFTQISVTLFDNGLDIIFSAKKELTFSQTQKLTAFAKEQNFNISYRIKDQLTPIFLVRKNQIFYPNFNIELTSDIFIQATKAGLENIVKIIRRALLDVLLDGISNPVHMFASKEKTQIHSPLTQTVSRGQEAPTRNVIDLYAGFGAYSFAIQDLAKSILAVEGDQVMADLIKKNAATNNLSNKIKSEIRDLFGDPVTKNELKKFDLAIVNPPRNGASPQVSEIAKSAIKNLIYVSCNPESFKRDAKILIDAGFKIKSITALDQFYDSKHLELVSIFIK